MIRYKIDLSEKHISAQPKITIITVVFNGAEYIEKTILSVINQTYDNIEYIILDGGSTDGTVELIKKYQTSIDYWESQTDDGIYDAMNKGIDIANGEWINFMNGGDKFYSENVVEEIFSQTKWSDKQIIFGNHRVLYPSGRTKVARAGKVTNLWKGSQFCHQATFIKVDYHKAKKFSVTNPIAGDFEFFYHSWKKSVKFAYVDKILVDYAAGGVSDKKRIDALLAFWTIVDKTPFVNFYFTYRIILETVKSLLK